VLAKNVEGKKGGKIIASQAFECEDEKSLRADKTASIRASPSKEGSQGGTKEAAASQGRDSKYEKRERF